MKLEEAMKLFEFRKLAKKAASKARKKTITPNNPKTTKRELDLGERAYINGALWAFKKLNNIKD